LRQLFESHGLVNDGCGDGLLPRHDHDERGRGPWNISLPVPANYAISAPIIGLFQAYDTSAGQSAFLYGYLASSIILRCQHPNT
jgi:hypothetical protein